MSMINDALRRAKGTAPASGVPPIIPANVPPALPPLMQDLPDSTLPPLHEPVEDRRSKLPIILAALFLFCVAGAVVIYVYEKKKRVARLAATTVVHAKEKQPASATPTAAAAAAAAAALRASSATQSTVSASAPVVAVVPQEPTAAPAPISPRPVQFPSLRLQSIFYKPSNPSVMISGRTLYLNDEVQGVTVAAIDPSSVTLVLSGQTNVLTLR